MGVVKQRRLRKRLRYKHFTPVYINVMTLIKLVLVLLTVACASQARNKCKVDKDVRFILENMTSLNVRKTVDCVVEDGDCDSIGRRLKSEARNAVRQGRCNRSCTCDQIQVRLVVNRMKKDYPRQWQRVVARHLYSSTRLIPNS